MAALIFFTFLVQKEILSKQFRDALLKNYGIIPVREYRPTTWAFLLGPAGGNFLLFLLLKATHKKSYLLP